VVWLTFIPCIIIITTNTSELENNLNSHFKFLRNRVSILEMSHYHYGPESTSMLNPDPHY
jgi:hypothetical protein